MKAGEPKAGKLFTRLRALLRQHWRGALKIRSSVRLNEDAFHLFLAGGVGVLGGLTNLIFYFWSESLLHFVFRHEGDIVEVAEVLDQSWQRVAAPALGGLAAGLLLHWGFKLARRSPGGGYLEAVAAGDGRMSLRSAVIKASASIISINSGASIGREGAIAQLTAAAASRSGQAAGWPPYRLRLLVACGVASGVAAAYNAPIAGAVFAAQIVLGNLSMNLFAPVVFSSVIAAMVSRSFFGIDAFYVVPAVNFTRITQLPWFVVVGALTGLLGALFQKMMTRSSQIFEHLVQPLPGRLALGGLIVGLIADFYPGVWGNGYVITNRILGGHLDLAVIIGLLTAKLLATVVTVGSGAVGGVITPTLFLGAGLGSAFGAALHGAGWGAGIPDSVFALVGMGGALSATTHSPLFALILVFEITLNYSLTPPLMMACVTAALVARRFQPESIYTDPLRIRGLLGTGGGTGLGETMEKRVGDLMNAPVTPVRDRATLREIADRFLTSTYNFLPVVDGNGRLTGMVALQDLKENLGTDDTYGAVIASDVMQAVPGVLVPGQRLTEALPILLQCEMRNIPVVNSRTEMTLIGSVSRSEVLTILSELVAWK